MQVVLFDGAYRTSLLPLTYARPVGELRIGCLTVAEKWAQRMAAPVSYLTQDYLTDRYPLTVGEDNLLIDASLLPSVALVSFVKDLPGGAVYTQDSQVVVARLDAASLRRYVTDGTLPNGTGELPHLPLSRLQHPSDVFALNDRELRVDFELLAVGRQSEALSATNRLIGPREQLFIEAGASIEGCTLNTSTGPIYVGQDALIMEGGLLRGPLCVGPGAVVKMGAKVYGATTFGPRCKVGGEISNVVFQANSNKGHDGYLGNSVIGEWCNLGADTNASNLKNDYGEVKVWSYVKRGLRSTGLQFHGIVMGDHSKTGINTMLNTGTVIGFSANVYGGDFPPKFIPSFSWGGGADRVTYRLDKAITTATRVMQRRGLTFGPQEDRIFRRVYEETAAFRQPA